MFCRLKFLTYDYGDLFTKTFVSSRNRCTFVAKIQLFCELTNMSDQKHRILTRIGRYFHRLGLAIIGKDYIYSNVYVALSDRVQKAEEDVKQLKEMYNTVLNQWSESDKLTKKLFETGSTLNEEVNSYKALVEQLRSTIRDKQAIIDSYQKAEEEKKK